MLDRIAEFITPVDGQPVFLYQAEIFRRYKKIVLVIIYDQYANGRSVQEIKFIMPMNGR